jgi:ferrous iron transport protein A
MEVIMTLRDLKPGQEGIVASIGEKGPVRKRIMDMGVTPGALIKVIKVAPLGDPIEVNIRGYELSLRKSDAAQIIVE